MDENTIFSAGQNQTPLEPVNPVQSPPSQAPLPEEESHAGGFPNIIKIIAGIFVILTIFFLVFIFIFPKIKGGGKPAEVTLTYWGLWEDASIFQPIIEEFKVAHPDISVEYVKQDIKQYRERVSARVANDKGPDVFRFHNSWVPMLSDVLLPLPKDTITKEEFAEKYYRVMQEDLIKNGAIYGIPLEVDTLALYVNDGLFESAGITKPPETWTDFVNNARQLTVKDGEGKIKTAGAALGTFANVNHAGDLLALLFVQNGVDIYNMSENAGAASDTLTFYTSFGIPPGNVWDSTLNSSQDAFAQGQLAMYFGYSWDFFAIKAMNPELSFSIYPVPRLGNQDTTIASYWAEGVSVGSKHQKEALLFLNFLARKETQVKLFTQASKTRAFGEPYSQVELASLLKDNVLVYPFVAGAGNAVSSFFADNTFDNGLNTQSNTYLENAVSSVLSGTSPQSAVDTLSQGISQLLKKYSAQKP